MGWWRGMKRPRFGQRLEPLATAICATLIAHIFLAFVHLA